MYGVRVGAGAGRARITVRQALSDGAVGAGPLAAITGVAGVVGLDWHRGIGLPAATCCPVQRNPASRSVALPLQQLGLRGERLPTGVLQIEHTGKAVGLPGLCGV